MIADTAHGLLFRFQPLVRAWGVLQAALEHHEAQEEPELRLRTLPAVERALASLRDELHALNRSSDESQTYALTALKLQTPPEPGTSLSGGLSLRAG